MEQFQEVFLQYALRAWGIMSPEGWLAVGLSGLIMGIFAYLRSERHLERAVSKRKKRAKHREMLHDGQQTITEAFEQKVKTGQWKREKADQLYQMIREGCPKLKELGPEPSFGRPWYYGPKVRNLRAVKAAIWNRLLSTKTKWDTWDRFKKPKKSAKEDHEALVASIKKHAQV